MARAMVTQFGMCLRPVSSDSGAFMAEGSLSAKPVKKMLMQMRILGA